MRLTFSQDDLRAAVRLLDIVPSHSAIAASQFVRFVVHNSKSTTPSVQMSLTGIATISVQIAKVTIADADKVSGKAFYVDRRSLSAFAVAAVGKILVDMPKAKGAQMVFQSGRRKMQIPAIEKINGYVEIPTELEGEGLCKLDDATRKAIACAASFAPQTAAADHLSCVQMVRKFGIMSTDHRHGVFHGNDKIPRTHPLPLLLSSNAAATGGGDLRISGTQALLSLQDGEVMAKLFQTVSDRCAADFPTATLRDHITAVGKANKALAVTSDQLTATLQFLKSFVFSNEDAATVLVTAKPGEKRVKLEVIATHGVVREFIDAAEPVAGASDLRLRWVIAAVLQWAVHLPADMVVEIGYTNHINFFRTADASDVFLHAELSDTAE